MKEEISMTKKDLNVRSLQESNNRFIEFYKHLAELKILFRQGWVRKWGVSQNKAESVADHMFSTAVFALVCAKELRPDLDAPHVALMLLVHDLSESITGDYTPSDNKDPVEKETQEREALIKIFAKFEAKKFFVDLWEEYQKAQTPEAQFAKDFDKLDAVIMSSVYKKCSTQKGMQKEFSSGAHEKITGIEAQDILDALNQK